MAPLRVLIVGAGIGGPALAFWLGRQGHDVTVVERYPELRASGQQLDLRAEGVDAVKRMGLLEDVRAAGVQEDGVVFIDGKGRERARFMGEKTGTGKQGFSSEFEIMRGNLCRVLYDASLRGESGQNVKYVFGVSVDEITQDEGSPDLPARVRFSDGTERDFDLVVGADGQGSRTRRMMLDLKPGDKDPSLTDLGVSLAFFTLPRKPDDTRLATARLGKGCRFVMTRGADSDKTIQVYYFVPKDYPRFAELDAAMDVKGGDKLKRARETWADVFRDAGWDAGRLADGLVQSEEAGDLYTYKAMKVECPTWHRGRVTLVGDSACSRGPNGLGTSTSIIGAYILAGELAKRTPADGGKVDVHGAMAAYEALMRPFMKEMPTTAIPKWFPRSDWGIELFYTIAGWIAFLHIDKILMMFHSGAAASSWKLPDYPELKGGQPLKK